MAKNIIKQIVITLLIAIAIVLVLAIILYRYIPSNKSVPSKVTAYKTPENVKAEISENITAEEIVPLNRTFEITDADLSLYKKSQSYNPGKSDPFNELPDEPTNTVGNNTGSGSTGKNGTGKVEDKNVTDNYYKSQNVSAGSK